MGQVQTINTSSLVGGWTEQQVEAYIIEAVETLRNLPDIEASWQHVKAIWPDHQRLQHDNDIDRMPPRLRPGKEQIERWEQVLDWLKELEDVADRKLVFWACWTRRGQPRHWHNGRAVSRYDWDDRIRKLITAAGHAEQRHPRTMRRRYLEALRFIASHLTSSTIEII